MTLKARLYVLLVCLAALYFVVVASMDLDPVEYFFALILLAIASLLAQVYELEIVSDWALSTHVAVAMAAVFIGGMPVGVWVVLCSTLPAEIILRWDKLGDGVWRFMAPVLFNTSQLVVTVTAAAAAFTYAERLLPGVEHSYFAMIIAFIGYVVVNSSLVAAIIALNGEADFFRVLRAGIRNVHLQFITMGVLAILMATLYQDSRGLLILALVPLALVHYATRNFLKLRRDSHLAFKRITELLAERDEYTGTHSDDVEELTERLAISMNLSDEDVDAVRSGAAIHDIGKIAIPDAILKKPGALDPDEFEVMKTHTIIGAEILQNLDVYRRVVPIVRHEHEHWDGGGYPDGLAGEDIPIGARIVAVADVYSALTTERGYRPAQGKPLKYSHKDACRILSEMAGSVLDPELVERFKALFDGQPK